MKSVLTQATQSQGDSLHLNAFLERWTKIKPSPPLNRKKYPYLYKKESAIANHPQGMMDVVINDIIISQAKNQGISTKDAYLLTKKMQLHDEIASFSSEIANQLSAYEDSISDKVYKKTSKTVEILSRKLKRYQQKKLCSPEEINIYINTLKDIKQQCKKARTTDEIEEVDYSPVALSEENSEEVLSHNENAIYNFYSFHDNVFLENQQSVSSAVKTESNSSHFVSQQGKDIKSEETILAQRRVLFPSLSEFLKNKPTESCTAEDMIAFIEQWYSSSILEKPFSSISHDNTRDYIKALTVAMLNELPLPANDQQPWANFPAPQRSAIMEKLYKLSESIASPKGKTLNADEIVALHSALAIYDALARQEPNAYLSKPHTYRLNPTILVSLYQMKSDGNTTPTFFSSSFLFPKTHTRLQQLIDYFDPQHTIDLQDFSTSLQDSNYIFMKSQNSYRNMEKEELTENEKFWIDFISKTEITRETKEKLITKAIDELVGQLPR